MAIFILKREEVRTLKIKKVDDKPMVIHTKENTIFLSPNIGTGINGPFFVIIVCNLS